MGFLKNILIENDFEIKKAEQALALDKRYKKNKHLIKTDDETRPFKAQRKQNKIS